MKNLGIKSIFLLLLCLYTFESVAQNHTTNSLYFMESLPFRHHFNPAFQANTKGFISIPIIGESQITVNNNLALLQEIVLDRKKEKLLPLFYNPEKGRTNFYNTVRFNTEIEAGMRINLFGFGFRTQDKNYWTVSASLRGHANSSQAKSPFELFLYKTDETERKEQISFDPLKTDAILFSDLSFGYSTALSKRWTVGLNASLLIGHAQVSMRNNLGLNSNFDQSQIKGEITLQHTAPGLDPGNNIRSIKFTPREAYKSPFNGLGWGLNLGIVHQLTDEWRLSAAINDIGQIKWAKGKSFLTHYKTDYSFETIKVTENSDQAAIEEKLTGFLKETEKKTSMNTKPTNYSSWLLPKLNIGAEYAFPERRLSLGVLSSTLFHEKSIYQNIAFFANTSATSWLDLSISCSSINGSAGSIGTGAAIRMGALQWALALDYSPLYSLNQNIQSFSDKAFHFSVGLNILLESAEDKKRAEEKFATNSNWFRKKKSKRTGLY